MTRTALVTGVGRRQGIGAAIVRALLDDGWDVVFTSGHAVQAAVPTPLHVPATRG